MSYWFTIWPFLCIDKTSMPWPLKCCYHVRSFETQDGNYTVLSSTIFTGQQTFGNEHVTSMANLHSKILDARPPLGPISFISKQFLANFGQIIGWRSRPPLGKSWIRHCTYQTNQLHRYRINSHNFSHSNFTAKTIDAMLAYMIEVFFCSIFFLFLLFSTENKTHFVDLQ